MRPTIQLALHPTCLRISIVLLVCVAVARCAAAGQNRGASAPVRAAAGDPVLASQSGAASSSGLAATGIRPIGSIGVDIRPPVATGATPRNAAATALHASQATVRYHAAPFRRSASLHHLACKTGVCHQPLYFEEVNLERYGTTFGRLQPAISAVRFFARFPQLPYRATIDRPRICYYHRHPFEAGRCAPWERETPRWSARATLAESIAVAGVILVFP